MADIQASPMLEARALHLWRGENHLLRGISFCLRAGEFLQVVGPNGVGKSTLLRAACNLLPLEAGEVLWYGRRLRACRDEFSAELVYLAHSNALKADLTAEENLRYEVALRRRIGVADIAAVLAHLGIEQCAKLPVRVLSAGQRRRVALARVLLSDASLWVLDEPTTNLDAAGSALIEGLLRTHLAKGGAALVAAHHLLLAGHSGARTVELQL